MNSVEHVHTALKLGIITALLLAPLVVSSNTAAAEPDPGFFKSVVTAENLDLANIAEFPANPDLHPADGKASEKFWLSLLGIRSNRQNRAAAGRPARRISRSAICGWPSRRSCRSEP